jgi:hypothetical protein
MLASVQCGPVRRIGDGPGAARPPVRSPTLPTQTSRGSPAHAEFASCNQTIERTFEEVKKRSQKMSAPFRNEGSCLLLFFANVREIRFQSIAMPA